MNYPRLTQKKKKILKSLIGSIQQSSVPFSSFVSVIATFERVSGLLNSWPIFHNESSVLSVKHLMFPNTGLSEIDETLVIPLSVKQTDVVPQDDQDILTLISNSDQTHTEFCKLFAQSVRDSSFQRYGKKVTRKQNTFQEQDFVLVLVASGAKYGIVSQVVSNHTVNVQLLNRNKKIKTATRIQPFAAEQITLLHRKTKPNIAWFTSTREWKNLCELRATILLLRRVLISCVMALYFWALYFWAFIFELYIFELYIFL